MCNYQSLPKQTSMLTLFGVKLWGNWLLNTFHTIRRKINCLCNPGHKHPAFGRGTSVLCFYTQTSPTARSDALAFQLYYPTWIPNKCQAAAVEILLISLAIPSERLFQCKVTVAWGDVSVINTPAATTSGTVTQQIYSCADQVQCVILFEHRTAMITVLNY